MRRQARILGIAPLYLSMMINGRRPWDSELKECNNELVNNFVTTSSKQIAPQLEGEESNYLALAGARGSRTHHTIRRTVANGFEVGSSLPISPENHVNSFLADREYRGLSKRTIEFYKGYITRYLNQIDFPALSASRTDVINYISSMECTAGGKHACFRALRAFYRWLENNEYIEKAPTTGMAAPKVPKPLHPTVPLKSITTLMAASTTLLDRLIITLLADTGLRRLEAARIKASDIDQDSRTITVWGKGSRERLVRYGEVTENHLADYLASIDIPDGGTIIPNVWSISNSLKRLELATGIKCNAHAFRRTFATVSIRNGMNVFHVQSLLGHSSLTMARIYAEQVNSEDAVKAYKAVVK